MFIQSFNAYQKTVLFPNTSYAGDSKKEEGVGKEFNFQQIRVILRIRKCCNKNQPYIDFWYLISMSNTVHAIMPLAL